MKFKELLYKVKPPCAKCPYKLGLAETLVNPCPQCKMNGYESFYDFKKKAYKKRPV